MVTVDCGKNPEVCKKNRIMGFPTIRFYPNGRRQKENFKEYYGDRSEGDMRKWVNKCIRQKGSQIVLYKHNNCGHCMNMREDWIKFQKEYSGEHEVVTIGCEKEPEKCK